MIREYRTQTGVKYAPKHFGRWLECVANLGIYRRTNNPHVATTFSSREKAKNAIKWYKRI